MCLEDRCSKWIKRWVKEWEADLEKCVRGVCGGPAFGGSIWRQGTQACAAPGLRAGKQALTCQACFHPLVC